LLQATDADGFSANHTVDGNNAIRFLTTMSVREHDFLPSIIQEEIGKVVGGVL